MSGDIALYLRDILESIKLLKKYTEGIEEAEFNKDFELQDAVTRRLEIVGEAVKHIPLRTRNQFKNIPWQKIAGMRDMLTHEYFGVNPHRVWKTIKEDLPDLENKITKILASE